MTAVLGFVCSDGALLASDGYALHQERDGGPVTKTDTYSKVRILPDAGMAYGFAGSHQVGLELAGHLPGGQVAALHEDELLTGLAADLLSLNRQADGVVASVLLAYWCCGRPRLALLPVSGGYEMQERGAAIGAGADPALAYLDEHWRSELTVRDGILLAADAIRHASCIPTVNALPMIVCVKQDAVVDLSQHTIDAHRVFLTTLAAKLADEWTSL